VNDPVKTACHRDFTAAHHDGIRDPKIVKWVVLHSTEGLTAAGAAAWFANPKSQGSAHLVVDDTICYRTLPSNLIPWAAKGANHEGLHIEQAGFARWTTAMWGKHRRTLERAAYKTALHLDLFKLPAVFVGWRELRADLPGVTTHAECTKAFGGDHTDPGLFWPRRLFMRRVRFYLAELQA